MSANQTYTAVITLIDKTQALVTPVTIRGDATGNLEPYRIRGKFTPTAIKRQKHGELLLRTPDELFINNGPILIDEDTKNNYQIDVRIDQPDGIGGTRQGELMRFDIGKPTIEKGDKGQYLMLPLIAPDAIGGKEVLDSERLRLRTPNEAFQERIVNYTNNVGSQGPLITFSPANIELPDNDALRQNYLPVRPQPLFDHLNEIIDREAVAPATGSFKDFYYYTFPNATATKTFDIIAKEFGGESTGVVIDALSTTFPGSEEEDTIQIDNLKVKNVVIARGANGSHSLPMDYARFASDYEHARISGTWSNSVTYAKDEYSQLSNHKFKSLQDNNLNNSPSTTGDTAFWENLTLTARFSRWTNDSTVWPANLFDFENPPATYAGLVPDMNMVGPDYNRTEDNDEFENITLKDVTAIIDDPSTGLTLEQRFHGQRVLVSASPTGDFAGQANRVAQYDTRSNPTTPTWHFSRAPVTDDTLILKKTGEIIRWNGSTWIAHWNVETDFATSSPLHVVKSIDNVDGPTVTTATGGTPAKSALEYTFEWDNVPLTGGNVINLSSRGLWWYLEFPFPRENVGSHNIGDFYANPTLDFNNLNMNSKGGEGWNRGLDTEDLGNLRGVFLKLRATFEDSASNLIDGMYDMPFVFWFRDLFDRVVYTEAKARRNGKWSTIEFDAGPNAEMQLHDNRTDELITILGYTLSQNFFLEEKEYTGVKFDWENVKGMGCFWKGAYDENFFYKAAQDTFLDSIIQNLTQLVLNLTRFFGDPAVANVVVDRAKLAIDELYFVKDAYVSSEDSVNSNSRQELMNRPKEFDYVNLKNIAKARKIRAQFHPQQWINNARGDNRMRYGQNYVVQGNRIPNSPRTLTCNGVTHILDDRGYTMQAEGVFKFVL